MATAGRQARLGGQLPPDIIFLASLSTPFTAHKAESHVWYMGAVQTIFRAFCAWRTQKPQPPPEPDRPCEYDDGYIQDPRDQTGERGIPELSDQDAYSMA